MNFIRIIFVSFSLVPCTHAEQVSYNRDVRPILSENCFACHGQDPKHRKAKLRLDDRAGALADRDGVRAIVPGDLAKSEAWARIISDDEDDVMPPPKSHKKLTEIDKQVLKHWIREGAVYEGHWSFTAPQRNEAPKVSGAANPIDAFLQDRLLREGLKPAETAKPETLVRRLYLDLTGLPPKPAEVDAFVADKSPQAWDLSLIHI